MDKGGCMLKYIINLFKKLFKKKQIKAIPVEYVPPEPVKHSKTPVELHYEKKRHLRRIKNRVARLSRRANRRGK